MMSRRDENLKSHYIRENQIREKVFEDNNDPEEKDEVEDYKKESNVIASENIEDSDKKFDTSASTKLLTDIQNESEAFSNFSHQYCGSFSLLDENEEVSKTHNPHVSEIGTDSYTIKETRLQTANSDSTREDTNANIDELKRGIQILKEEVASSKQSFRNVEAKYKNAFTNAMREKRISEANYNETARLLRKVELLEQQRNDLLNAFKKQTKLLDILKRQKCHTEAIKILSIVGEEFITFTNK